MLLKNRKGRRALEEARFCQWHQKLLCETQLSRLSAFLQHGSTSRLLHSEAVAYYSFRLALFTGLSFHLEELVRGALLHDYFFYDAKRKDPARKGHWVKHPVAAAKNAGKETALSAIEKDIIQRHMFPLTLTPPGCREGMIVSLMDKVCSVYEFFWRGSPYPRLRREVLDERKDPAAPNGVYGVASSNCSGDFSKGCS